MFSTAHGRRMEFFQGVAERIFSERSTVVKFHFTDYQLREKHSSTKK